MKRIEIWVTEHDASLMRKLATILRQGDGESALVRMHLRQLLTQSMSAKELLAAAPLEGIPITRSIDRGRIVDPGAS